MKLQYDPEISLSQFLRRTIKHQKLNIDQIGPQLGRDGQNLKDWLRYQNRKPNLEHLIQLSELLKVPFKQLYWYRMTTYNRKHVSLNASLNLISNLMIDRYLSNLTSEQIRESVNANPTIYNHWNQLKNPIPKPTIDRFANLFNVNAKKLHQSNIKLKDDPDFDFKKKLINDKDHIQQPPISQVHAATLADHLNQIVKKHPVYHSLKQIVAISGIYSSAMYQTEPNILKQTRQVAKTMHVDLQTLLYNSNTKGKNQMYANVKAYCRNHHLTLTKFERLAGVKKDFITINFNNKYLNSLVKLARIIPTTIDQLVTPDFKKPITAPNKKTKPIEEPSPITVAMDKEQNPQISAQDQQWLKQIHDLDSDQQAFLQEILTIWGHKHADTH